MGEEETKEIADGRSFEERVFARFDVMETLLYSLVERVEKLEYKVERQAMEIKPIWERALAEIMEVRNDVRAVRERVDNVERKVVLLHGDMLQFRADQARLEQRVDEIVHKTKNKSGR